MILSPMQAKYDEFKGKVEKVGGEDENNKVVPDRPPRVEVCNKTFKINTRNLKDKKEDQLYLGHFSVLY